MKTAIVTDSNSGINSAAAEQLGIFLLPMPVIIDGKNHLEGIDIDCEQLFTAMESGADCLTSQPSPASITELWDKLLADGYESIVHIPMTAGLSGSCQSAKMLSLDYDGKVTVADNRRISVTQLSATIEAKHLADTGMSADEIVKYLEESRLNTSIYLTVDSLKHLQKGGRLSPAAAMLGTILNIKPILEINDEKIEPFAKIRGMKLCKAKMISALQNDIETKFADIPQNELFIGAAGTMRNPADIADWQTEVQNAFPDATVVYHPLPCSIACHVGPECIAVALAVRKY